MAESNDLKMIRDGGLDFLICKTQFDVCMWIKGRLRGAVDPAAAEEMTLKYILLCVLGRHPPPFPLLVLNENTNGKWQCLVGHQSLREQARGVRPSRGGGFYFLPREASRWLHGHQGRQWLPQSSPLPSLHPTGVKGSRAPRRLHCRWQSALTARPGRQLRQHPILLQISSQVFS